MFSVAAIRNLQSAEDPERSRRAIRNMINIGVIGVGVFGLFHLRAFRQRQREGKCRLVCAAAATETRLAERCREFEIRGYTDWRTMLDRESLDAVSIVTPDHLHFEMAREALRRGLHVLVEKPLDVTQAGCQELIEAARARNVLLQVDFHKRYDPYHIELRRMIAEGRLGEIRYGYCHMEDKIAVPRDWFPAWAAHSSPAWFLGIHFFDLMRWLLGSNAVRVYATGTRGKLDQLGIATWDSVQTKVEYASGAHVTFDTCWILPDGFESTVNQGLRLVGTEGIMEIDSQDRGARGATASDGMRTYNMGYLTETRDRRGDPLYLGYGIESIADFIDNLNFVREGGTIEQLRGSVPLGEDGLEATRIAVAAHCSLETGVVVEVDRT